MEIIKGIEIAGLAIYLEKRNSLIIGDVHIGYEEELNRRGVLIPRFHFRDVSAGVKDTIDRLQARLKNKKLREIIINGDLKHAFGSISTQEWREVLKFLDLLAERSERIILIKGNHDVVLGRIAEKRNIKLVDGFSAGGTFITHGHRIPDTKEFRSAKILIIGNEHPAISVKEGPRTETFKCFLKGKFRGKTMIVMPSFNPITTGTDVLKEKFISPFLNQDVKGFEVFIAADRTYYFGKIRDLG